MWGGVMQDLKWALRDIISKQYMNRNGNLTLPCLSEYPITIRRWIIRRYTIKSI